MTTAELIEELEARVRLHEIDECANLEEGRVETAKLYAKRVKLMKQLICNLECR